MSPVRRGANEFGSDQWNEDHGLRHGSRPTSDKTKRVKARAHAAEVTANAEEREAATFWAQEKKRQAATLERILGPTGKAHAIKLIPIGRPFTRTDLEQFIENGLKVFPAGTVSAKMGFPLAAHTALQRNPDDLLKILGASGEARAVILASSRPTFNAAMVERWRNMGFDIGPAPVRLRDGLVKNPSADVARATKKAHDWFRRADLVTAPEMVNWTPPKAAVHVGQILAIEYASDKFDGEDRAYRHEVTKHRELYLSPDGSTLIVDPPFKITTRGIEG